jgi:uncharacterized membrane protein YfcA
VSPARVLLSLLIGLGAGAVNAVAGGGTLIMYPALVALGLGPIAANATSTVALWPGYVAATVGFREQLRDRRRLAALLAAPALGGGGLGAFLLLNTPARIFEAIVPVLVLGATVLLAIRPGGDTRRGGHEGGSWSIAVAVFLFVAAVYGGYFGAGLGFVLLGGFSLFGMRELLGASGLRIFLTVLINGVAAAYFALAGRVRWPEALAGAVGAVAGGYLGATVAKRLGGARLRPVIVVLGVAASAYLLLRAL